MINPSVYLPWLLKQFLNMGGKCQKKTIYSISEVVDDVDIVVNCTGVRSKELFADKDLLATRGHNLLVKAPHIRQTMSMETKSSYTYVIPRSDGTVILGTTKEDSNRYFYFILFFSYSIKSNISFFYSTYQVSDKTVIDILRRAIKCCPRLGVKGLDGLHILENIVGLRPTRKGGPRIQNEFHSKFFFFFKKNTQIY